MTADTPAKFEIQGRFSGFFRDFFGKRRMVLRVDGEEIYLKVPKPLRAELAGVLVAGQEVVVLCEGAPDDHGWGRCVVSQVRVSGGGACVSCPIRICAKKNCWNNGGRELFREFERQIESAGLGEVVRLKAVGCMDHCKKGPNMEVGKHEYHHCSVALVNDILAQIPQPAA